MPLGPIGRALPMRVDGRWPARPTRLDLLPLKALEIEARIDGLVAETRLRQPVVNACPAPLEACLHLHADGDAAHRVIVFRHPA
jgi:hypothetical protein